MTLIPYTVSQYFKSPNNPDQKISYSRLSNASSHVLLRALAAAELLSTECERFFSYSLLSKLPYSAVVETKNNGPIKARALIHELTKIFENPDLNIGENLASLGPAPKYPDYLIPWSLLSGKSKSLLHKAMTEAGVRGLDFKTGFTYSQLVQVRSEILIDIGHVGERRIDQLNDELKQVLANLQSSPPSKDQPVTAHDIASNLEILQTDEKSSDKLNFTNCNTTDDLYRLMLDQVELMPVMQHFPFHEVDERKLHILKARHPAFCAQPQTHEEIGRTWGVSRERIRQIEKELSRFKLNAEGPVFILDKLAKMMTESKSEDGFKTTALELGLVKDEKLHFSAQRLHAIAELFEMSSIAENFAQGMKAWESTVFELKQLELKVKNQRSQFGLVDLKQVSQEFGLTNQELQKIIGSTYPRSLFAGNLALARTIKHDTMFEGSIAKQLSISSPLHLQELKIGLQRTAKNRIVPIVGAEEDVSSLIVQLAGDPPTYEYLLSNILEPIQLEQIDTFLVETLRNSQLGVMHRNEIIDAGLKKGIHPTSIGIYLSHSPFIRTFDRAIFGLVGTLIDIEIVQAYAEVYRKTATSTEVDLEVINAFEIIMKVKPNINTLSSGTIFLPFDKKDIFIEKKFQAGCSCGTFDTKQVVKLTDTGFWNGFATMFQHGISAHGYTIKSMFVYKFDFKNDDVTLLI